MLPRSPSSKGSPGSGGGSATSAAMEELLLTPSLFSKFQSLIYNEAGIWLGPQKQALLTSRLARRLRLLGLSTMKEYFRLVSHPDQQHERALMLDCITTNETHFFREPKHFDYLAQHVFPRWKQAAEAGTRTKNVNVWSAGCSSGEEPYSLAMLLLKHLPQQEGWLPQILASDISTSVLEKARAATFSINKVHEIPKDYLRAYMLKGTRDSSAEMRVIAEVQKLVRFSRINLFADSYPVQGQFDLIFCRNVLIYFDERSKQKVIAGLARHLSPSGLLFVGHSEHLCGTSAELKSVAPTVYSLKNHDAQPPQSDKRAGDGWHSPGNVVIS
jgi:chemotaxis protein methyltransferase CheR